MIEHFKTNSKPGLVDVNFERTPNYDFIYVFMKSEEEVLSLLADFLIHFEKKNCP